MHDLHKQLDEKLKEAIEFSKKLESLVRRTFNEVYEYCKEVFDVTFRIVPWSGTRSIELKQVPDIEKNGINSYIRVGVNDNRQAAVIGLVFPSSGSGFLMHWLWAIPVKEGIQLKYGELEPITLRLDAWEPKNADVSRNAVHALITGIITKYIEHINSVDYAAGLSFHFWERLGERR